MLRLLSSTAQKGLYILTEQDQGRQLLILRQRLLAHRLFMSHLDYRKQTNRCRRAFRYNTTTGAFEGYTDSWGDIGGSGATNVSLNEFSGNGSTTAFTLSADPSTENNTQVYIDGVYPRERHIRCVRHNANI